MTRLCQKVCVVGAAEGKYNGSANLNLWRGEILMEWTSEKYKNNLMEYEKRDGIKAIIIYSLARCNGIL